MYNWHDVAERTEKVYESIMAREHEPLIDRLRRYHECGPWAGKLFCAVVAIDYLFWRFLEVRSFDPSIHTH
jgi:phosphatidylinositol glycan class A protein